MRPIGAALFAAVGFACGGSPSSPDVATPGLAPVAASADWPASTPQAQGLNATTLTDLVERLRRGSYGPVSSLLIARHQQLAVEEYFRGWSADRVHTMQSVTKSVTSLLTGIAVDRGRLSIDDSVISFFPGYAPIANLDDRKRSMTVRDLLMMRTGLDWSEATIAGSPLDQLNGCGCDWLRFVLDWPMREPPGTRWEYVSGGTIVLGGIVGVATGQRIDQFAAAQLFGPLGITNTYWIGGQPGGLPHSGGGLGLRPRDMLKIGQLVLDGGRWRGAQVVSDPWIRESTAPLLPSVRSLGGFSADYGYLWWRLPNGVITASGAQGQWIFVVPSADLVVSVTGESDADFSSGPSVLYANILPAITDR
jgi:CubicO group peptidase (beta-lactamase class C family)